MKSYNAPIQLKVTITISVFGLPTRIPRLSSPMFTLPSVCHFRYESTVMLGFVEPTWPYTIELTFLYSHDFTSGKKSASFIFGEDREGERLRANKIQKHVRKALVSQQKGQTNEML